MNKVEKAALAVELDDPKYDDLKAAQDYPGIAAMMRARLVVENPEPRNMIPKRYALGDLLPVVGADTALEMFKIPGLVDRIEGAMEQNARAVMASYLAVISGLLTEEQQVAVAALLAETEPDPAWVAEIPGESVEDALGFRVTEHDIQAVLV